MLLVSTDPASHRDEVLGVALTSTPTAVPLLPSLFELNIDPVRAADDYRVCLYNLMIPAAAIASVEEQVSGACTLKITAFDEFSIYLADHAAARAFDKVLFPTASTGYILRPLELHYA